VGWDGFWYWRDVPTILKEHRATFIALLREIPKSHKDVTGRVLKSSDVYEQVIQFHTAFNEWKPRPSYAAKITKDIGIESDTRKYGTAFHHDLRAIEDGNAAEAYGYLAWLWEQQTAIAENLYNRIALPLPESTTHVNGEFLRNALSEIPDQKLPSTFIERSTEIKTQDLRMVQQELVSFESGNIDLGLVMQLINPAYLPPFEKSNPILPSEDNPFSWSDHTTHVKEPRTGFAGALLSALVNEAINPGTLSQDVALNYAAILLETALLFNPLDRRIIRALCLRQFEMSRQTSSRLINPQLEHHLWHNIAQVGTETHTWGIRDKPVSYGQDSEIVLMRRQQGEKALQFSRKTQEPLPLWKERPQETVHYELAFRLATQLSHPDTFADGRAAITYGKVMDFDATGQMSDVTRLGATLNYFTARNALSDVQKNVEPIIARLEKRTDDDSKLVRKIMHLNMLSIEQSQALQTALKELLRDRPEENATQLLGYKQILLPRLRTELFVLFSRDQRTSIVAEEFILPGESFDFLDMGPDLT